MIAMMANPVGGFDPLLGGSTRFASGLDEPDDVGTPVRNVDGNALVGALVPPRWMPVGKTCGLPRPGPPGNVRISPFGKVTTTLDCGAPGCEPLPPPGVVAVPVADAPGEDAPVLGGCPGSVGGT